MCYLDEVGKWEKEWDYLVVVVVVCECDGGDDGDDE